MGADSNRYGFLPDAEMGGTPHLLFCIEASNPFFDHADAHDPIQHLSRDICRGLAIHRNKFFREMLVMGMSSCTERVVHRPVSQLIEVRLTPLDHVLDTFLQTDLRFPSKIVLDRRGIQPIARILPQSIFRDLA